MLYALRDFIHRQKVVSMSQLTREFHIASEAIVPMLALWIKKGVIRSLSEQAGPCASVCRSCQPKRSLYYEWC